MAPQVKSPGRKAREEREKMLLLKHKFENRITVAKFGKENLSHRDYSSSISKFVEYLQTMSEVKKVDGIYSLKPGHFDPKKDVTEMLMISHIYFEMARVYDAAPRFSGEAKKSLEQFVLFSVNQPFQVMNSELLRKHIKKSLFKNPELFHNAYQQIFVQSKKCYIVTFCYGDLHPQTQKFREFKDWLLDFPLGQEVVRIYYQLSSKYVPLMENKKWSSFFARTLMRPTLHLFSKVALPFILKK